MDTFIFPYVRVPVLSKTIVSTLLAFSRVSLFLTSIPFLAQIPSPTTMASGVARPKAQGQATTKTVTKDMIASFTL